MSGIFGAGIFPGGAAPATYRALVEFFEGDRDRADAWLVAWLDYADSDVQLEAIFDAVEAGGTPAEWLAGRPVTLATDYQGAPIAPGFIWQAIEVANTVSTVEVATDYP